jgi:leukotriene-A4 hydrolase
MVEAAERLYGPYRWGRYDILVLPPSFPFGGMENPRLTFATPTILAGDRSLVALVAHELGHSWSGNLVTNALWDDFWLNEGFTVYVERRLMEELRGRDYSEMLAALGRQDLEADDRRARRRLPDTHLHLDLAGRDPDEGMTDVAYEKGYFFLRPSRRRSAASPGTPSSAAGSTATLPRGHGVRPAHLRAGTTHLPPGVGADDRPGPAVVGPGLS